MMGEFVYSQESHMDCALMVTGAALEAITQESLMEDLGTTVT